MPAETFTHKVERLKLQLRTGKDPQNTVQSILEDVAHLPVFVLDDAPNQTALQRCKPEHLLHATPGELSEIREKLAPAMKYKVSDDTFSSIPRRKWTSCPGIGISDIFKSEMVSSCHYE